MDQLQAAAADVQHDAVLNGQPVHGAEEPEPGFLLAIGDVDRYPQLTAGIAQPIQVRRPVDAGDHYPAAVGPDVNDPQSLACGHATSVHDCTSRAGASLLEDVADPTHGLDAPRRGIGYVFQE